MSITDRLSARLSTLRPEQRALFEKLREKQRKEAVRFQPPPVPRVSGPMGEGDWPLSLDQERFWFMEQLYPGGAGLNISAASRMRGPLSVPAVAAALDEIVRRHAAWRTAFPVLDGVPVQRVAVSRHQPLALLDLSALPEERKEPEVLHLLTAATAAPFPLETGPLVRSALVRLGARDHVCILTVHHLVTDWISFQIAFSELAAIYAGRSAALPPPPIQYPDFAIWQRSWLQGEALDGLVSWWREQLAGFPLALELPTDRPRPAVARGRGGRRVVHASRELSEAVRSLARREGATLFMAVLAATAALVHRLSGQEKLILGANNANRNRPELEPVLGCFLTQVPFPIDLTGDPTFRELLARVRKAALGALAHQDLPFGKLVEAIQPERDTSRQPLVQALVQVLDGQASKAELAGVEFEPVDAHDGNARYDLMLTLFDYPEGLAGSLEHDSDLFDPTTAERLAALLFLEMESAAADPELRLSELPVLSREARHQALVEWNDTARPLPGWTLPGRFAAQAARTPDAVAVIAGSERLTYGEIDRRSDELARRLHVEPGSRVALLLGRTPDVPIAILAAWKAGAAYVPLDPEWPAGRLETVLADAEPALLIHRGPLPASLDVPALDLASSSPGEQGELPGFLPDRLAYLIYTSGTTGRPKAVMVEHGSVAAMVGAILDRIGAGPDERVPHLSRYTFDVSLLEIFVPLLSGGACEIVESDEVLDPAGFLAVLERSTRVFSVPALLRRAAAAAKDCRPQRFAGLRTLTSGGDLAAPDLLEELLAAFPSTAIEVLYGPTETSIICTGHRLSRTRQPERSLIGRPLDSVEARVMDPRGRPVALGVPGELWIGGPGVARGYFRRDELTAERFVEVDGRRFYRTGDLVRQVPGEGGELEFLGRVDDQVKVRGFRIEPGEIEAALLEHPAVREAVVMAISAGGSGGDKQLVAWVVGTDDAEALRAFLRGRLPEYMLPAVFVPLDALPVTAHGKVDRKALPAPGAARATGSAPPRNAREELLAGIWREALGLERVGIHDNFFQLGGDSILSIQIVARARRAGLQLTTRQFFDNQTIAGLAGVAGIAEEEVLEERVEGEVPLTPVQRRFFAEGRQEPWRFNQAVLLTSRGRLERAPLAAALERLARHHDALRLRFVQEADGWHQFYAPAAPVPLLEADLPPEALEAAVEQLQSGLDLQHGPLFTAALFHLGAEDRLLLTAHHLIVDAVSWRVLLEDLTAEELPPKTTSWKRWAELLAASSSEEEIPYWQAIPSVPPLPVDAGGEGGRATLTVELGAAETRALLRDAPEVYRTQANDLLLAALARAFAAWTGESTLLVDLEGHGREEIFPGVDLSRTVGWFTTLFPVALRLGPGAGPRESILAVKETLRAVPRRGLGFGLLRERLSVPEPQVSFNYLGRFDAPGEDGRFAFAPEAVRGTEGEAVPGRHLFAIDLLVLEDRLRATWTYDPSRHLPATAERLARGFLAELETLVEHCLSPEAGGYSPSDFPLAGLGQAALDRLLGAGRDVEDLYPLAPLQEGILFHSVYTPGADLYFEQLTAGIEGPLDAPAFAAAWQTVVERHAALRTAFLWREAGRPLQLVRRKAEMPWRAEDWRGLPPEALDPRWRELLAADRALGFDLARAPLMRLALVRTGEDSHRLAWSSHHLIFDGWCFSLILAEVFALYRAAVAGEVPRLAPARPYRDYIAWLAERDESEAEAWWRQELRGFAEPTAVPFDRPGGGGSRADDYFERSLSLPASLSGGELEALAQRLQVTLSTLVQGAWALLLSHYAQSSDVVFGAVVSGRPAELPGVESIVGLFINTVPVRIDIPEEEASSAWLARLQAGGLGVRHYQWTPLVRIRALADVPAGEPLFTSLLVFENYPMAPSGSAGLGELRIAEAELAERTNYPLTLIAAAHGGFDLRLTADRRFEPATVQRLLSHLGNLLGALAAGPGRPPASLPLLSEAERHQLTAGWNDTASAFPGEASIPALFAEQAALRPAAVAVEQEDERLTYGELQERALRVARRLRARGVRPGERVAVLAERSPELIAALLGILQAGAAYVPLDPAQPPERRAWMVEDAGATLLALDGDGPEADALPAIPPGALAYVLYTSGSTGTPKGVAVSHRSVIRLVRGADFADMGPDQAWLQCSPVAFDLSTLEIWAPLLNGGRLVLFPGRVGSLDDLARVIARHGVTSAWLTAGLFHEMVDGRLEGLRPLRQLLAGGDVVSAGHARRTLEALPGLTLIDGYGPTEVTTFTACHRMTDPRQVGASVPIGRPIANTRAYVLDSLLRPVPVGVWGELYAGGEGVARGYLGRPDLTAERFLPDPFAQPGAAGSRLYRTGDMVRWLAHGILEFQGRRDGQIKVRGFRIEPVEVEAALVACPGVLRAAAVGFGPAGGKRLAAFWVGPATAEELRARLRARLPEAMVPAVLAPLPDLPLTPNGKVDRRSLAALALAAGPAGGSGERPGRTPPRNGMEESLVEAVAEVLEREPAGIGVFDSFFDLGGHSLLATRLVSRLRSRWGIDVPMGLVFETPHLAALAERLEVSDQIPGDPGDSIPRRPAGLDPLPASYAQERLWFLDRLQPGSPAYNIPAALRLAGDLDVPALERAFAEIVRRHEALRTTFPERGGAPVQRIAPPAMPAGWTLPVTDLSNAPGELERLAREDALAPFDLARGPLLRTRLLRLGPREHVLLLAVHHIAADLWALQVLVREVGELYAGRPLPGLPIQYADFAVWQRARLTGEDLDRQVAFWRGELAGAPPALELPVDRARPRVPSHRGSSLRVALGAGLSADVGRLARDHGATPFIVLLAALGAVCGRWAGQDDVVLGAPIANRQRSELEGLIGMFVNTLPLRVRTAGDPPFSGLLPAVRRTALAAYMHQDVPFERLVEELHPPREGGRHPLFQVVLALQNVRQDRLELPGLTLELLPSGSTVAKFDLTLTLFEGEEGFAGDVEWATDLFDAATVERLLGSLRTFLAAAAAEPGRSVGELPLLSEDERRQVLVDWNDTASPYPREATIHGLFAEQAALRPDAVAVEQGDARLTYRELHERAERLARRLVSAGVRPEQPVAVLAERTPDLIVTLLAILQAGGAYLPLDPGHPQERRDWMVEDAGAAAPVPDGPGTLPLPHVHAGSLAYVMYTSGSTGTPKGVAVTHRNVIRLVRGAGYAEMDRTWLQYAPVAFDASTLEIWGPLLNGGRLVLFPGRIGSLSEIARVIESHGVTSAWLTAGLFHEMVDGQLDGLEPLAQLLAGGDVLSPDHARRVLAAHPGLALVNGYGPTEGTTFTCCHRVTEVGETVPIGRPIANTRVYVLDERLEPVPAGVWGELYAGGDGIARGYLNRPGLTAERFVPDPFAGAGDRLYRTGDRVRWRADGTLEFQGRLDAQVKVRGIRVEPGEVEAALLACPGVSRAAVVPVDGGLASFWVGEADPEDLRAALRARLPEAMVPSLWVPVPELPLTPNGKVDRRALTERAAGTGPAAAERLRRSQQTPPRNPLEERLVEAAAAVLERDPDEIGVFDSFFDLGGHSLLATRFVSQLHQRWGLDVPLQLVFDTPHLAGLADAILERELGEADDELMDSLLAEMRGDE